jgi:glycosyltransferase involved in cell wall biosynthesis
VSIERYDPGLHHLNDTAVDHWNRYLFARRQVHGPAVLDIGCGSGYGTELLADVPGVTSVVGVDNSYEALFSALSRRKSEKVEFLHSSDATFSPLTGQWQTIVALEIWEHLRSPRTAALCSRLALPASGRLVISLPLDEQPGRNEHHLHTFTIESARSLVSEFFTVTDEYHQPDNITFVARPREKQDCDQSLMTVLVLVQAYGGKNGAYLSVAQEIRELLGAGMTVVALCDDPGVVKADTGAEAFFLPLESSFAGDDTVSPVHLSAACAVATWFNADVVYAAHEFMPLARAMAEMASIPTVMHLRGLPTAGWYDGGVGPDTALPASEHCQLVANSETTALEYAMVLGRDPASLPIVAPRVDFARLDGHERTSLDPRVVEIAQRGPMMLFVASTRNIVKGFEHFLAMVAEVEARCAKQFTFAIAADAGHWPDWVVLRKLTEAGVDADRVFLINATDKVGALYRMAAVCVIPSIRAESFCRVAAEALGLGVPVVGFRGGHLNYFRRYGAMLVERGDAAGLAEAAINACRGGAVLDAELLRRNYGLDQRSKLPNLIARAGAASAAGPELVITVASDGLSHVPIADWVDRICLVASHGLRVCVVLSTSSDAVGKAFLDTMHRKSRPGLLFDVVRRPGGEKFVFGRAINSAAARGFERMPAARGVLCVNDDCWPSHLAVSVVRSWLDLEGVVGAVCPLGAGGDQDCPEFFRQLLKWRETRRAATHRLSGYWLYVSRETWSALEGFDERFVGYGCEDTDLCLRAWQQGHPLRIDGACYVDHITAGSFGSNADLHITRETSLDVFMEKHGMTREMYQVPLPLMHYGSAACE